MFCPYCANQLEDGAKFCNTCGKSIQAQPEEWAAQPMPRPRRWKPWMTVTAVVLGTVLGAGAIWGTLIAGISSVTKQIMGYSYVYPSDSWMDVMLPGVGYGDGQQQLMRTWSMTGSGYYGDSIWWITFDEDEVQVELQTPNGTEDYGDFDYIMVGDYEFYIPDAGQAYTFEINDGGNMLTLSPGLISNGTEEYWFSFGMLS